MYSSTDILAAIERGVITISNFDRGRLGPNSYDLLLGHYFFEVIWDNDGPWYIGPRKVKQGGKVEVPVAGTLLAMTADVIGMTGKITAMMKARSSTGREAMAVCKCAGLGDVGYHNHWTMEMTGFSQTGIPFVTVGQKIAQIAFFETKSKPIKSYQGQYKIDDWPLCMVPKRWRHRIVSCIDDVPNISLK